MRVSSSELGLWYDFNHPKSSLCFSKLHRFIHLRGHVAAGPSIVTCHWEALPEGGAGLVLQVVDWKMVHTKVDQPGRERISETSGERSDKYGYMIYVCMCILTNIHIHDYKWEYVLKHTHTLIYIYMYVYMYNICSLALSIYELNHIQSMIYLSYGTIMWYWTIHINR